MEMTMSKSTVGHQEIWRLLIEPEPGEKWPVMLYANRLPGGPKMQPEQIALKLYRGDVLPQTIKVYGRRLKRDGTPGLTMFTASFGMEDLPDWAAAEVRKHREQHNLTDEALSQP